MLYSQNLNYRAIITKTLAFGKGFCYPVKSLLGGFAMKFCYICEHEIFAGQKFSRGRKGFRHLKPDCNTAQAKLEAEPLVEVVKYLPMKSFYSERLLGSRLVRLSEYRSCHYCDERQGLDILCPGEEVIRETWLVTYGQDGWWDMLRKRSIIVRYRHFPECPWPDDFPDECSRSGSVVLPFKSASPKKTTTLRKAA